MPAPGEEQEEERLFGHLRKDPGVFKCPQWSTVTHRWPRWRKGSLGTPQLVAYLSCGPWAVGVHAGDKLEAAVRSDQTP